MAQFPVPKSSQLSHQLLKNTHFQRCLEIVTPADDHREAYTGVIRIALQFHPMPPKRPKRYLCAVEGCDKAYNRPALLRQHERTHSNERPFTCDECPKSFMRKSHLQAHTLTHRADNEKPFQCKICGKGAHSPQLLRRHELTHTNRFKCDYEGCKEEFQYHQSLKHHVEMVHEQVLICEVCNRRFANKVLVADHKFKTHGDILQHQCPHPGCFHTFKDAASLQRHRKKEHPKLKCLKCGKECIGKSSLRSHMVIHSAGSSKLLNCEICNVGTFVKKAELVKHYQDIHAGEYPEDVLTAGNAEELERFLREAELPSLQTLKRDPNYSPNLVSDESVVASDGATEQSLVPLPKSGASIIELVLGNLQRIYTCPRSKCRKKFQRYHAYEKHLKWHEAEIERIDVFLESLNDEEKDYSDGAGLDHFSDFSDIDEDVPDALDIAELDAALADGQVNGSLQSTETSPDDDLAEKQKELDELISMELAELNA